MKFIISLLLVCAFSAENAIAADFEERPVIMRASSQLIEKILGEIDSDYKEQANNSYSFRVKGKYNVILFNREKDIQLYAGFEAGRVTLTRINEWNKTKRFSRAYLDKNNNPVIEADLDFEGGATGESILRFIAIFAQSVEIFAQEIQ